GVMPVFAACAHYPPLSLMSRFEAIRALARLLLEPRLALLHKGPASTRILATRSRRALKLPSVPPMRRGSHSMEAHRHASSARDSSRHAYRAGRRWLGPRAEFLAGVGPIASSLKRSWDAYLSA